MTNMKRAFCIALAAGLTLGAGSGLAVTATSFCGDFINSDGNICVATELLSMDLTGTGLLPLGRATGPAQTMDVDGYRFVNSTITIHESPTLASTGYAFISRGGQETRFAGPPPQGPVMNGDLLRVSSFFDVFFEVSLTDVDPVNNYQGPSGGLPDGVTLGPIPNGTSASVQFDGTCVADLSKVNYGCLPPTGNAYIGHFKVVIPLGFDINGNAADDVIQFTLATHNVGAVTNTSVSGANALDTFNTTLDLEGLVQDAQTDPPFSLQLTGPTTASQNIVVPAVVPEPGSAGLLLIALAMLRAGRRRARR